MSRHNIDMNDGHVTRNVILGGDKTRETLKSNYVSVQNNVSPHVSVIYVKCTVKKQNFVQNNE